MARNEMSAPFSRVSLGSKINVTVPLSFNWIFKNKDANRTFALILNQIYKNSNGTVYCLYCVQELRVPKLGHASSEIFYYI